MQLKQIYEILYKELGPQHWWPGETVEEIVIGAILTQNTTWKNVEKSIEKLKEADSISFSTIKKMDMEKLTKLIYSSGYYNQKAKRLKRVASFFMPHPISKIEDRAVAYIRAELLQIKGVGKETADTILLYALKKPVFVIDAYTRRILQRLNNFANDTSYDKLQTYFMDTLPRDVQLFNEFHALLVKFAKLTCKKIPLCEKCVLAERCENFAK